MPQGWTDGFMPNGSSPNCLADFRIELQTTFVLQSPVCVPSAMQSINSRAATVGHLGRLSASLDSQRSWKKRDSRSTHHGCAKPNLSPLEKNFPDFRSSP